MLSKKSWPLTENILGVFFFYFATRNTLQKFLQVRIIKKRKYLTAPPIVASFHEFSQAFQIMKCSLRLPRHN